MYSQVITKESISDELACNYVGLRQEALSDKLACLKMVPSS